MFHFSTCIVFLEGAEYCIRVIDEIDDEYVILAGICSVQSRIRLNDFDVIGNLLINVHRTKLWLVEASLEFVRYDHHSVFRCIEGIFHTLISDIIGILFSIFVVPLNLSERIIFEIIELFDDFAVFSHNALFAKEFAGESYQRFSWNLKPQIWSDLRLVVFWVSVQICFNGIFVTNYSWATGSNHHCLGITVKQRSHVINEMFDNEFSLAHNICWMQVGPFSDGSECLTFIDEFVWHNVFFQPVGCFV